MINIEAIQRVDLKSDNSATLALTGPRKSLQLIPVPAPYGRELWQFVLENLSVVEFGEPVAALSPPAAAPDQPGNGRGKTAVKPRKKAEKKKPKNPA